jgi:hypothetical protein
MSKQKEKHMKQRNNNDKAEHHDVCPSCLKAVDSSGYCNHCDAMGDGPYQQNNIFTCQECGKVEDVKKWIGECQKELKERNLCRSCNFWYNNKMADNNRNWVIIDGNHYVVKDEEDRSVFRGHGGMKIGIAKNNGETITTTNLWHQGCIPNHLKKWFVDNNNDINNIDNAVFTNVDKE